TALRQAEAARRETEGRLRTVIESLAEGLLVQDRQGVVIDCNPAARVLLGLAEGGAPVVPRDDEPWLREDGTPLPPDEHPGRRALRGGVPVRNVVLGIRSEVRGRRSEVRSKKSEDQELARCPGERPADLTSDLRPLTSGRVRWILVNSLPLAPRPGTA